MLICGPKSIWFCIHPLKTWQPVMPKYRNRAGGTLGGKGNWFPRFNLADLEAKPVASNDLLTFPTFLDKILYQKCLNSKQKVIRVKKWCLKSLAKKHWNLIILVGISIILFTNTNDWCHWHSRCLDQYCKNRYNIIDCEHKRLQLGL